MVMNVVIPAIISVLIEELRLEIQKKLSKYDFTENLIVLPFFLSLYNISPIKIIEIFKYLNFYIKLSIWEGWGLLLYVHLPHKTCSSHLTT